MRPVISFIDRHFNKVWIAAVILTVLATVWAVRLPKTFGENGGTVDAGSAVTTGYKFDRQIVAFRPGVAGADTLTVAGALATTEFKLNGRQNLTVTAHFSGAAATCTVRAFFVWKDSAGVNYMTAMSPEIVLTASAITDAGGKFVAPTYAFDGFGALNARILVTSLSAGTVDLWTGSY